MFHKEGGLEKVNNLDLCLLGHFLTDRNIKINVMKEMMASV